ncbi:MAG TPA: cobalamin-binding protein, partial [Bryobacteraceae bacterium]|nr:cobalamin-binding protein [Bryobacteraceae bacterium]
MRIVPLIASATEMVHALGLGEFQVGRSHECDYPPEVLPLPVCTSPRFEASGDSRAIDARVKSTLAQAESVYRVFEDVLASLQPTHIITQTQCRVCAVSLEDVERALSGKFPTRPRVVALEPNSLKDIRQDFLKIARACGVEERGVRLVESIDTRFREIGNQAKAAGKRPRVAVIEWPEPLMAAGNWVPELLAMVGAENLFGTAGEHSPWMKWEELAASDPDAIVCAPCGYDLKKTREEMHWLTENPVWANLRAVRQGRVYLADGNQYLNRPGARIVESLRIF